MQNVVNLHCPFLFHGEPIVNGRVYFVKEDTAATTYNSVAGLDNAFFVPVYDKDGHALPNPLSLDSEGVFSVQPFVDEDTDYKMIVCRPTGISPELNDETQAWEVAYTMDSKTMHMTVDYQGIAKVDSVAALRQQDPSVGSVLVLGYGSANDFCPPRIFTWTTENWTDNNGTKIRSTLPEHASAGTWICVPDYFIDVRWFGVQPGTNATTSDCWDVVNAIVTNYYPGTPIYFPKGYYRLSENLTVNSAMVLDNGTYIRPVNKSITVTINRLENRGGKFARARMSSVDPYYNVYPKIKGELRTSWLTDPAEQISNDMLANVSALVFDSNVAFDTAYTISKKRVLVKSGVTVSNVTFNTCEVFYEDSGSLETKHVTTEDVDLVNLAKIETVTPATNVNGILAKVSHQGSLEDMLKLLYTGSEIFSSLKMPALLIGDQEGGFQNGWVRGEIGDEFPGLLTIHANAAVLKYIIADTRLYVKGDISHAKSARSKIVLTFTYDGFWSMNVKKDGVDLGDLGPTNDYFYLGMLEDAEQNPIDIFEGARDFDVSIFTGQAVIANPLNIVLPYEEDEEKIVAVNYHPVREDDDKGLKLFNSTEIFGVNKELEYYGQPENYDNSFFGMKIVRTEAGGDWFFDPFTI